MVIYDENFKSANEEIWQFVKNELNMTDEDYWFDVDNATVLFKKAIAEKKFTAQQCIEYLLSCESFSFAEVVIFPSCELAAQGIGAAAKPYFAKQSMKPKGGTP